MSRPLRSSRWRRSGSTRSTCRPAPPRSTTERPAILTVMATTGVAVLTGAGSGVGRCVAGALLAAGWRVALAGRRKDALAETAASAAQAGVPGERALIVPAE